MVVSAKSEVVSAKSEVDLHALGHSSNLVSAGPKLGHSLLNIYMHFVIRYEL